MCLRAANEKAVKKTDYRGKTPIIQFVDDDMSYSY